ncbi:MULTISPECIES: glutathione S-transferase family protein [Paraglaciecola]|mgnify:CR=1 FL=1|jgi:glutathione S-transferase|uniref:glutathione transferase n=3 Tax=Paraglaciecola TaxID=1621534 RepID=A0A857JM14_9ALTE|nr:MULTISPECIES: glutathione S-transferase [Paraglaciecola]AEE21303.1 Glutathione S-transferase domain protein [Glaciecola sp. 4H-3-7+YE-5]MBN26440.1 glutathione S-transferase [Alteromonadaceae bacterium]MDO6561370.1 glutathione S-transferase [Paraglaciecola chathamensis]MDO6840789.1 glutathione S-transferase [Paraglaciecola chathamensis]QHJ12017.1 Dichloromethane dehalogenase [Paraglaciecola mesophila]
MITLHHLNNSRSQRILWMLEELGVEYDIERYQRDSQTNLAPESLKKVHQLGKSPVITDGEVTVAESGAIIDYLARKYSDKALIPEAGTEAYRQYTYWLHFAEGTMMPPMVAKLVFDKVRQNAKPFFVKMVANKIADKVMDGYYGLNLVANLKYVEQYLAENEWFAGDTLTGADIQMSFPLEAMASRNVPGQYPNIAAYVKRIHERPAYQQGLSRGGQYDYA